MPKALHPYTLAAFCDYAHEHWLSTTPLALWGAVCVRPIARACLFNRATQRVKYLLFRQECSVKSIYVGFKAVCKRVDSSTVSLSIARTMALLCQGAPASHACDHALLLLQRCSIDIRRLRRFASSLQVRVSPNTPSRTCRSGDPALPKALHPYTLAAACNYAHEHWLSTTHGCVGGHVV